MGLLDDLKKQADALKAQDTDRTESLRSTAVAVDHALRRTFLYLNDLGKQLNVVQMPSPFAYELPTVGRIDGLVIKDFFCDFRSKHFIDKDYYGEVHIAYRCWSDKVLTIKKGPDDMEKFRDLLWQSNIEHKSEQFRNERKVITHEVFKVSCDFRVQGKIEGDHESGRLKIVVKNVGGFSVDLYNIMGGEMNDQAVEEFAKYFIGRPNHWVEIAKRSVLNQRPTQTVAPKPKPKVEPTYVQAPKPAPAPVPEEKKGLFGSLKGIIKKD
ncbi:MAG TPA: hypothetical protein VKR38_02850 [Usitatibacter sp.]|nr:hypothetical protein [Usitatibacter sp.]